MVMSKPALPEDQFRVQKWFDEKAGSVSISIPSSHNLACEYLWNSVNTTKYVIVFTFQDDRVNAVQFMNLMNSGQDLHV